MCHSKRMFYVAYHPVVEDIPPGDSSLWITKEYCNYVGEEDTEGGGGRFIVKFGHWAPWAHQGFRKGFHFLQCQSVIDVQTVFDQISSAVHCGKTVFDGKYSDYIYVGPYKIYVRSKPFEVISSRTRDLYVKRVTNVHIKEFLCDTIIRIRTDFMSADEFTALFHLPPPETAYTRKKLFSIDANMSNRFSDAFAVDFDASCRWTPEQRVFYVERDGVLDDDDISTVVEMPSCCGTELPPGGRVTCKTCQKEFTIDKVELIHCAACKKTVENTKHFRLYKDFKLCTERSKPFVFQHPSLRIVKRFEATEVRGWSY